MVADSRRVREFSGGAFMYRGTFGHTNWYGGPYQSVRSPSRTSSDVELLPMEISRADLTARYRDKSDDELLLLLGDHDLTDLAREVALAEATARGLRVPAFGIIDANEGVEVAHGHGPLCICAR